MLLNLSRISSLLSRQSNFDEAEFRDLASAVLARHRPDFSVTLHDDPLRISVKGHELDLKAAYDETVEMEADDREDFILWHIDNHIDTLEKVGFFKTGAFADVRSGLSVQIVKLDAEQRPSLVIPFASNTGLAFVYDTGGGFIYVSSDEAERWGISIRDIHDVAMANLDLTNHGLELEETIPAGETGKVVSTSSGDSYDASRLLSPTLHERLLSLLGPIVYLAAPNRDFLLAWTDSLSDAKKLELAADVTTDSISMPYPKSDDIFVLTAKGLREANAEEYEAHGRGN